MDESEAVTLQAIRCLQHHPGNLWKKELQVFQARARAGEEITAEVIELLSSNENVCRWMQEQIAFSTGSLRGYEPPPGSQGIISTSNNWVCPRSGCTKSLPVIQEGEDPPSCELHRVRMVRRKGRG